jgi:hypothetical protein
MPGIDSFASSRKIYGLALSLFLLLFISASAQDPGQPDSMIIGNLDGSVIEVSVGGQAAIPVWVKTDDSVTFMHIPLGSDDTYIESRDGGVLYPPLSLWDDVEFRPPDFDSPDPGLTNQSLLGFAYISDPRDPENFLHTNYQWVHVADFLLEVVNDDELIGETTCLFEGESPTNDGLIWGLEDGVTQVIPAAIYPCLVLTDNVDPEFVTPEDGSEFDINQEFLFEIDVVATDDDYDNIELTALFPGFQYEFEDIEFHPGYSHKIFRWIPQENHDSSYTVMFIADDNNDGVTEISITLNVTPSLLDIPEVDVLLGSEIILPIILDNSGLTSHVGGFDILIQYDTPMACITDITRTERLSGWDYFHYTLGDSATARIVGLADVTGNGVTLQPGSGPIIDLHLEVTSNDDYLGQYAWIRFLTEDSNDNTVSDSTGYRLVHPQLDDGWLHAIDPDDVLVADINLNGIPWEISDAVLLANYLVNPEEFPLDPVQYLASDTNGDQDPGTVADLVYLLGVILGDMNPPRINYGEDISAHIAIGDAPGEGRFDVYYQSSIPAGGTLLRIDHAGAEIGNIIPVTDMRFQYVDKDGVLSVLIYDLDGRHIFPGSMLFEIEVSAGEFRPYFREIQLSDQFGNSVPAKGRIEVGLPISYNLSGAYPNPFNSSTSISFTLPVVSDVEIIVYNIMGQKVTTLEASAMLPGERSISWDGTNSGGQSVASGVYLYRLKAGEYTASSRMMLLK